MMRLQSRTISSILVYSVHLSICVAHHCNEKVEKEEEDDHDKEAPVDLAFMFEFQFLLCFN